MILTGEHRPSDGLDCRCHGLMRVQCTWTQRSEQPRELARPSPLRTWLTEGKQHGALTVVRQ